MTLIVTCDARDAVPFLLALPVEELAQAKLITTPHLAERLEQRRLAGGVQVTAGVSTLKAVRQVVASSRQPIAIVIGPDPGNPFRCKGLMRARLLAPWSLDRTARADLIEIGPGGRVSRISSSLTQGALLRTVYVREGLRLVACVRRSVIDGPEALVRVGLVIPVTLITLARVLPFIAWTEAYARFAAARQ